MECNFGTAQMNADKPLGEIAHRVDPCEGQIWRHKKNGKRYFIHEVSNRGNSLDDDINPPIVHYMDGKGGRYSRYLTKWHQSFDYHGRL